jgi:type I restriction enzyme, S subunit
MPDNWIELPLSEVTEIIGGGTPKRSVAEYWGGKIPWLSVKDFNKGSRYVSTSEEFITEEGLNKSSTKILHSGQLIISARGTVGALAQLTTSMAFNQSCYGLDAKTGKAINDFLYYLVKYTIGDLQKNTHGAVFDTVTRNTFNHVTVKLPPLPTQKRIADILGSLDDKIELNRQMNQTLEAMARATFKSWFIDFDPVRAKMEGRDYPLPAEVMDLFPDELVESELGLIPRGWKIVQFKEIIDFNPTYSLPKGTIATYLEMKNLPQKGYYPASWYPREFKSGTKFTNGNTLLARITPCLENGKTGYVNFLEDGEVAWGSTEYIVMQTKGSIPNIFSYFLARNEDFRSLAIKNMTGSSGRQRVQRKALEEIPFALPTMEIFAKWGELVNPFIERIKISNEELSSLSNIRDTLLPKLISGEIED